MRWAGAALTTRSSRSRWAKGAQAAVACRWEGRQWLRWAAVPPATPLHSLRSCRLHTAACLVMDTPAFPFRLSPQITVILRNMFSPEEFVENPGGQCVGL